MEFMKNSLKLAKNIRPFLVLVTIISVTFFITSAIVIAAEWAGPSEPPPDGNLPGFIYNVDGLDIQQQNAEINIGGSATVNSLEVAGNANVGGSIDANAVYSNIFEAVISVSSNEKFCLQGDCITEWPAGGESLWLKVGTNNNIYYNAGNVGIGTDNPQSKLDILGSLQAGDISASNSIEAGLDVKGNRLCIGEDCRDVWPDSAEIPDVFWTAVNPDDPNSDIYRQNGDIGIGTNNPNPGSASRLLHIKSAANQNAEIDIQAGDKPHWAIYQDYDSEELRIWHGADKLIINKNGDLKVPGGISRSFGELLGNELSHYSHTNLGYDSETEGQAPTVGGGESNDARGDWSVIAGGSRNVIASDLTTNVGYSVISGGSRNIIGGRYSIITGGLANQVNSDFSWVGGRNMQLMESADNTFVWGYADTPVSIDASDAFIVYSGNVGIGSMDPTAKLAIRQEDSPRDLSWGNNFIFLDGGAMTGDEGQNKYIDFNAGTVFRGRGPGWATRFTATENMYDDGEIVGIYREESNPLGGDTIYNKSFLDDNVIASFKNNGYVGIGTNNPAVELDIDGDLSANGILLKKMTDNDILPGENEIFLGTDGEHVGLIGSGLSDFGLALFTAKGDKKQEIGFTIMAKHDYPDMINTEQLNVGWDEENEEFAIRVNYDGLGEVMPLSIHTEGSRQIYLEPLTGYVGVGTTTPEAELDVNGRAVVRDDLDVNGNLNVSGDIFGNSKNFVQDHPTDPTKQIIYTSLEGGEAGTYARGSGKLTDGQAIINLPEHFSLVTNNEGITVQLTLTSDTTGLYVASKSNKQIIVKQINNGKGNAAFDYLVNGVRKGYENRPVIIEKGKNLARVAPQQEPEEIAPAPPPIVDDTQYVAPGQETKPDPAVQPQPPKKTQPRVKWYERIGNFFSGLFK